jgi:hypothetical protein
LVGKQLTEDDVNRLIRDAFAQARLAYLHDPVPKLHNNPRILKFWVVHPTSRLLLGDEVEKNLQMEKLELRLLKQLQEATSGAGDNTDRTDDTP